MAHVRVQIREALKSALVAGVPIVSGRVFTSRLRRFTAADLPCLIVMTPEEPEARRAFANAPAPARLERDLTVGVEALAARTDGAEDQVDAILAQAESALHATRVAATLGGLIPRGLWPGFYTAGEDLLDIAVFSGRQAFTGTYYCMSNAPEAAL